MDARDITETFELGGQPLTTALLREQDGLMNKYKEIEKLPTWPLHLDIRENQTIIKDYIARVTEELVEAEEYMRRINLGEDNLQELMQEELIDALHFYIDVILLVGKDKVRWDMEQSNIQMHEPIGLPFGLSDCCNEITYYLFVARNQLKNKPWKQSELPTDKEAFYEWVALAGQWFNIMFYATLGWTKAEIYSNYMKKHTINVFRQDSKY